MFIFGEIWAWGGWAEDLIIHDCPALHHLEVVSCVTVSHCQEGSCKFRLHQHTQRVQIKGDLIKESDTTEQLGMHTCWKDGHYIEVFSLGHTLNEHLLCVQGITLGTGNAKTIKAQCLIVKELSFVLEGDAQDDVKSLQSCPTLCDPMDCSPPGSSVHGILQAKILK